MSRQAVHIRVVSILKTYIGVNVLKDCTWTMIDTPVYILTTYVASPDVSMYAQKLSGPMSAHVDQATESSMSSIVWTLMNVSRPTTARTRVPTL